MPVFEIEKDGEVFEVDAPDMQTAAAALGRPPQTAPPPQATMGMMEPSTAQGDPSAPPTGEMSEEAWAAMPAGEKMRNVAQWGGKALAGMFGMGAPGILNPGVNAVEHPKTTMATAAIPLAAGAALRQVPGIMEGAKRLGGISKARAGANIQAAEQAAGGVPINPEGVGTAGLRAMELKEAGGRLPQVVSKLMQRITSPDAPDLTFAEARDFYSNLSRLSTNEFGSLNPTMQRQIGLMKEALHESLVQAAGTVGKGEQYAKGISEYAKAGQAAKRWDELKPVVMKTLRGLGYSAAAAAGYKGLTGGSTR